MPKNPKNTDPAKKVKKPKQIIIQLPDTDMIQAAKLKPAALEAMVKNILGGQTGRGIDQVVLRGGQASGPADAAMSWIKNIWTRDC